MLHNWAKNLVFLRENAGESQLEVATVLGLSRSTYANYEAGINLPNIEIVEKILGYYAIDFDTFLFANLSDARIRKKIGQKKSDKDVRNNTRNDGRNKPTDARTWWAFMESEQYSESMGEVYDLSSADLGTDIRFFLKNDNRFKVLAFIQLPDLGKGIHFRIPIQEYNMSPIIKPADKIVMTYLPEGASTQYVSDILVLLNKDNTIECSRLKKINSDAYEFSNENTDYKPFKRNLKDIIAVFKVVEVHSRNLGISKIKKRQ
jgi:Predicted transcriptional regulators